MFYEHYMNPIHVHLNFRKKIKMSEKRGYKNVMIFIIVALSTYVVIN